MISVLITMAFEFGLVRRRSLARLIDINPALHPMPERLKHFTSSLMLYLFKIMLVNEGTGEKTLQFITRMSTSRGSSLDFLKSESRDEKMTSSASFLEALREGVGGSWQIAGGKYVSSPKPDRAKTFIWKSTLSRFELRLIRECFKKQWEGDRKVFGGLQQV